MVWEGVPWFVDGGEHSPEVARLLAYAATKGGEGVIGPGDCKVTASAIPDGNVNIAPGGVALLNQFPGGVAQSYLVRNVGNQVQALTPQGSSGVRYDLVCVIVEDPQYPGQPDPPSIPDGPYVRVAVYEDVPANTRSLAQIDPDQTGYALARVKFDASDGTVTNADITNLRELLFSRQETHKFALNGVAEDELSGSLTVAPPGASWAVDIPTWAKKAVIEARWSGVKYVDTSSGNGAANGTARVDIGTVQSDETIWRVDANGQNKPVTQTIMAADEVDVSSIAGTTANLRALLARTGGQNMTSVTVAETTVVAEITFKEVLA